MAQKKNINDTDWIRDILQNAAEHRKKRGYPFVTLCYAQSLDGSIARSSGRRLCLSGQESLAFVHKLRSIHDAILVGIGTILSDNPHLTVRYVSGKNPQPVIADTRLRFPLNANLLHNHPRSPWIATGEHATLEQKRILEEKGARILHLPTDDQGRIELDALLKRLGELGMDSLIVEGGARILTSFLLDRKVDYIVLTIAPFFVGGLPAISKIKSPNQKYLPCIKNPKLRWLGKDLVVAGQPCWEE